VEFLFVDTMKFCPENYQSKLQCRAVTDCYQRRAIRTVNPWRTRAYKIAESIVWLRMKTGVTSTAKLGRTGTFTADQE